MFHSARITLTVWYLIIIMTISIVFSVGFYNLATFEFQRIIRVQEFRQEHPQDSIVRPRAFIVRSPNLQDLREANERLRSLLILLNGVIFVITGAAGYFLAGRTLKPIQEMVAEQHRFITDASHELRTPLTSLRTEIEVGLRSKALTLVEAKKLLESNLEDIVSLQSLTNHLLALTKSGKAKAESLEAVSLQESLDAALRRLSGSVKKKKMTVIRKVGDLTVQAVPEAMTELFVILLDNAVKYSSAKSTITIEAKKMNREIVLTVSDEGNGIAEEELSHVFERFYRADTSRSGGVVKGYGLGLSIAKNIVSSYGGVITAKRNTGPGTTFTIRFPAGRVFSVRT
ncbi:MAG: hypothetical protein RLZZ455_345 [Candidatus Parcubacteria bacterium]|jgi:signal transduction histidine kinase